MVILVRVLHGGSRIEGTSVWKSWYEYYMGPADSDRESRRIAAWIAAVRRGNLKLKMASGQLEAGLAGGPLGFRLDASESGAGAQTPQLDQDQACGNPGM